MFEASDPPVFKWYLKTFGKDVNLFIDHSQIVELNAWRLGLWGDADIWKGKEVHYQKRIRLSQPNQGQDSREVLRPVDVP